MALSKDASRTRKAGTRLSDFDFSGSDGDWPDETPHQRDWKKLVLVFGLGSLSWVATYIGMLELIQSNMGDLPLVHKAVIGFSVAMLMTMIIWLLDQMFAPIPTATKLAYVGGYMFLTLISVGFGFGFYWKVLESRSESSRSAESAVTQVQTSLHAASTRMEQLSVTLDQLKVMSSQKAELERDKGGSCPNSGPGDGPRRKLRDADAQRFAFAADFVRTRVGGVKNELSALDGDLAKVTTSDKSTFDAATGTRNEFMHALERKLEITVTGFNAFRTDPQLKQLRSDLAARAEKTAFPDGRGRTFACPDPQLQQALKGVVRAIDQLPDLQKPEIAAVEGSEATIEAFRRLTATFYGLLSFKLPPSPDELRELQKKAVQSVEASPAVAQALSQDATAGLSKRDYIPLAIAVFVDLCLLLVSMSRPMNRLHGLVPKMRAAERGPIIQILSRFNEIHRDDEIRQNFEVFRHVVFDFHGAYYVAVPLDAPHKQDAANPSRTPADDLEDLRLEAHLLSNLFTSFEKEKIFSRVYSPLLTTRAIKKKLQRQGSKFAHAEAFRVYRFRDGAWSEIILGAVMGAARRVEAEKKKRRLEQQLFHTHEPAFSATLSPANDMTQPAHSERDASAADGQPKASDPVTPTPDASLSIASTRSVSDPIVQNASGLFARRARARAAATAAVSEDNKSVAHTATVAEFGPYAARANREIAQERYRATLPTLRGEEGILDRPRRRAAATNQTGPSNVASSMDAAETPVGEIVPFSIPGETQDRAEPNGNMAAAGAERVASQPNSADEPGAVSDTGVIPTTEVPATAEQPVVVSRDGPHGAKGEPRIGVILRRETATFTLPVTEATLPGRLMTGADEAFQMEESFGKELAETETTALLIPAESGAAAAATRPETNTQFEGNVSSEFIDFEQTEDNDADEPPLFEEPDIDIQIDAISQRFSPPAAE